MKCLDFVGKDFEVELSKPYPFQHSGEADRDPLQKFRLRVADEELEFVLFMNLTYFTCMESTKMLFKCFP